MHRERENPSVLAKVTQVSDVALGPLVFHKGKEIYFVFFFKSLDFYLLQPKSNKILVLIGLFVFLHLLDHVYPLLIKQIQI
jgi:hypothetical protein